MKIQADERKLCDIRDMCDRKRGLKSDDLTCSKNRSKDNTSRAGERKTSYYKKE